MYIITRGALKKQKAAQLFRTIMRAKRWANRAKITVATIPKRRRDYFYRRSKWVRSGRSWKKSSGPGYHYRNFKRGYYK